MIKFLVDRVTSAIWEHMVGLDTRIMDLEDYTEPTEGELTNLLKMLADKIGELRVFCEQFRDDYNLHKKEVSSLLYPLRSQFVRRMRVLS